MTELYHSLSHSKWDCKYHVVFVVRRQLDLSGGREIVVVNPKE
jgi:hypothetical protein